MKRFIWIETGVMIVLVMIGQRLCAQTSGWVLQSSGTSNVLHAIQFVDGMNGWAAGEKNTIVHTTDGGQTWTDQSPNPGGSTIYGIYFYDANNGWAAEDGGSVLKTTDGGAHWVAKSTTASYALNFSFINTKTGWMFGGLGAISYTTDGGDTWQAQTTGYHDDFYAGKFFNADTGVAVGYLGRCIKTTNGGSSWHQTSINLVGSFTAVSFVNSSEGWACGYLDGFLGSIIAHTTDGGETWTSQKQLDSKNLWGLYFTDTHNGWACGDGGSAGGGVIVHTTDGGTTWEEQSYSGSLQGFNSIFFTDSTTGWIAGSDGSILHTTMAGITSVHDGSGNQAPEHFSLQQNYPNPFNPSTTVEFSIPRQSFVTLKVYDLLGREVTTLVNEELQSGSYKTEFNGVNLSSGTYFYRMVANGFTQTKKFILMK